MWHISIWIPPAPLLPEGDNATATSAVVPSDTKPSDSKRQYIIQLSRDFLSNSQSGEIIDKGYIVVEAEYGTFIVVFLRTSTHRMLLSSLFKKVLCIVI